MTPPKALATACWGLSRLLGRLLTRAIITYWPSHSQAPTTAKQSARSPKLAQPTLATRAATIVLNPPTASSSCYTSTRVTIWTSPKCSITNTASLHSLCMYRLMPQLEMHLSRRGKEHRIKPTMAREASKHILQTQGLHPNKGTFPECLVEEVPALGKLYTGHGCSNCNTYISVVEKYSQEPLDAANKKANSL